MQISILPEQIILNRWISSFWADKKSYTKEREVSREEILKLKIGDAIEFEPHITRSSYGERIIRISKKFFIHIGISWPDTADAIYNPNEEIIAIYEW